MPVEIKELVIKVRIDESGNKSSSTDLDQLKKTLLKECKKEITKQLKKNKER